MSRNCAFLSELLGKTAATVQNKRHEKEQLWLILLMNCCANHDRVEFVTSSSGQFQMTLSAQVSTQIFEVTRKGSDVVIAIKSC